MDLQHTNEDEALVAAQLGRTLRGRWAVAARCHLGIPTVIENHPRLEDGSPFPTLFWLTCPVLVRSVSSLEAAGWMTDLNERLSSDPHLKGRLADAIARFTARRDGRELIQDAGAPPGGGPDRVKCLHAHTAHELADPPNQIGALALALTGWPDCVEPCYKIQESK